MAFWALGIVVAPMLGPVAGGWLTDNYSWRWVFYINIPIGVIALILTQLYIFDPTLFAEESTGHRLLGNRSVSAWDRMPAQIMLDKGQKKTGFPRISSWCWRCLRLWDWGD